MCAIGGLVWLCGCRAGNEKSEETQVDPATEEQQRLIALGETIVESAQLELKSNLTAAIQEQGLAAAVGFCNANAGSITTAIENEHNVTIKRISNKNRNPENIPSKNGSNVLEQFAHEIEEGKALSSTLLTYPDKGAEYYAPIKVGEFCLNCHGMVDDLQPELIAAIDSLYPQDKAKGYVLGELRGAWLVEFSLSDG